MLPPPLIKNTQPLLLIDHSINFS